MTKREAVREARVALREQVRTGCSLVLLTEEAVQILVRAATESDPVIAYFRRQLEGRTMVRVETKPATAPVKKPMTPRTKPAQSVRRPK
jgi:hypothetical protein